MARVVRTPLPKAPGFAAKLTSNHTTDETTVVFDTVIFDNGGDYDSSTGKFTAPVAGVYSFTCFGARYYNDPTGDYQLYIQKNGTSQIGFMMTHESGRFTHTGGTLDLSLAAGDDVKIRWDCAGSGNKRLYGVSSVGATFAGHLVQYGGRLVE